MEKWDPEGHTIGWKFNMQVMEEERMQYCPGEDAERAVYHRCAVVFTGR